MMVSPVSVAVGKRDGHLRNNQSGYRFGNRVRDDLIRAMLGRRA
jgi:hypothetical protein